MAMSVAGVVVIVVMSVPWVALCVARGVRAWRNPGARPKQYFFTRRYIDEQFKRPRDESELL